jgi:NSS family neurotransmitter:Na+ symporter
MPLGWVFGLLFFVGLFGAAYLSDVAAFEVLVGGLLDNWGWDRKKAVFRVCAVVYILAIPPMINMKVFVPWDLTFGSGMQALGSLFAVITAAWFIKRYEFLRELNIQKGYFPVLLRWWLRIIVPAAILFVGINWFLESVFDFRIFAY